jgi:NTE family protein
MVNSKGEEVDAPKKVVVGCQGGGMHAAFAVGVLTEILSNVDKQKKQKDEDQKRFELVGLSGTSAGALCALMTWYGLAPKNGIPGSAQEAIETLNDFWWDFLATTCAENVLNFLTYRTFWAEQLEIPVLGVSSGQLFGKLNPYGAIFKWADDCLPILGVRKRYFDLIKLLADSCPALKYNSIEWKDVNTRLLIGASEVINGFESVFDSDVNKGTQHKGTYYWRQRLPLSLDGVAASGTLPIFREAQHIEGDGYYWDGLYSQNPPVREFFARTDEVAGADEVPDEVWIVRINPQQWPIVPKTNADIQDRENELMGNLSLHKELDFILKVNEWSRLYKDFGRDHKQVTVRTIKMKEKTADELQYASKFDRSREFSEKLCDEGCEVARDWLDDWRKNKVGKYPEDAAYRKIPITKPITE